MSEEVKAKKKISRFGLIWLAVCVLAMMVAVVGPFGVRLIDYNNHQHSFECYSAAWSTPVCSYGDNGIAYALAYGGQQIIAALVVANLVMVIWWALRKEKVRSALFGRVWFISLFVAQLLSLGAAFLRGYLPYTVALFLDALSPILTYIILTIGWVIGCEKWNFHGIWVGLSYLAYLLSYLLDPNVIHTVRYYWIKILLIVAVWIVYIVAQKQQKAKKQQSVPFPAQPVYYSPAAYLGAQTPTTETAGGHTAVPVEELHQLQALLDGGIITQEEFDAKKKQLLGL